MQPLRTMYRFINKQSNLMKTREPKLQTQAREKLGTENPGAPVIWTEGKLQQRGETQLLEY